MHRVSHNRVSFISIIASRHKPKTEREKKDEEKATEGNFKRTNSAAQKGKER